MSQAQAPCLPRSNFTNQGGWRDEDFYRIKLVCDRVDRIGFWYYLTHLSHALRDFTLWLKFRKIVKAKDRARPRPKTFFKWKKKEQPRKIKEEVVEVKEEVDTKLKEMLNSLDSRLDGYGGSKKE